MPPLPPELRRDLERAVVRARDTAEEGARNALAVLGVEHDRAPEGLSPEERSLRVALRAQARSLGGGLTFDGLPQLREQIAYAAWHRMLFARFLAENSLLIEPASGAPVSMDDVAELARDAGELDPWVLAARFAAEMLPGIFGISDPTTRIALAPDDRVRLEAILKALLPEVFTADDALGWVYQFWQSKRKAEVNKRGDKIGGADLAPVTQLFTEHYIVRFLLENSLGAWWAGRHPKSPLLKEWEYLRFGNDGSPAAGSFDSWPARAAEITVVDPCMGSGHFLVAAADMLREMRIEEEGLSVQAAAEAVIRDNLFGLELDPRCTQLAAFALAFNAWKAIGQNRPLPIPNVACSGIAIRGQLDDWRRLAGEDSNLRAALERLYEVFQDAPELGSLIDPRSAAGAGRLWSVEPDRLLAALDRALAREPEDPAATVFGVAAQGATRAAGLLGRRYVLCVTNPPFLSSGRQSSTLAHRLEESFPESRHDLATAMLARWVGDDGQGAGVAFVTPQAWLFSGWYQPFRRSTLATASLRVIARLGTGAFGVISGAVVNVALIVIQALTPRSDASISNVDASDAVGPNGKAFALRTEPLVRVGQLAQLENPEARVMTRIGGPLLSQYAQGRAGICSGDYSRFGRVFWEIEDRSNRWAQQLSTVPITEMWGGREHVFMWDNGQGEFIRFVSERLGANRIGAWVRGTDLKGRRGVAVSSMAHLPVALYTGELFDNNTAVILPTDESHLAAIWCYCSSSEFVRDVRVVDQSLKVTNESFVKVPFDLDRWTKAAAEEYPDGLPEPDSEDPTQWLFKGNIVGSDAPLQVAVARLLGYRWPDQDPDGLDELADPDGIVCLPFVAGDAPAAERLERLLAQAYGSDWTQATRAEFLSLAGSKSTTLEGWLRDEFFEQHARLFHNRPFIWHVWDGRRDGFSALLDYHLLDQPIFEKLTYHHLGDWLERQKAAIAANEPGAEARLAAATELQRKLQLVLQGEPPYDIYVRWKSLAEQPIGWERDLDDGVRLNIRPFVKAGILRAKVSINWNKDRGRDPDGSERLNDAHLTLAQKRAAREALA